MTASRHLRRAAALLTVALVAATLAPATAQTGQPLDIGAALPLAGESLARVAGGATTLADQVGDEGLAVVFWSNTCPWVAKYEDRVLALADEYESAGIGFVLVNANDPSEYPEEGAAALQQHAQSAGYGVPYVVDEGSRAAVAFGATRTPQVFLFDADRRLVYEGTVDDSPSDAGQVEAEYLRDAMNQLIAGEEIAVQKTKAFGCTIKFY